MNDIKIIDNIAVEIKATLSVDERTFKTCLDLISIRAKQAGFKGVILTMPEDDSHAINATPIYTEEGIKSAHYGLNTCVNERNERKNKESNHE